MSEKEVSLADYSYPTPPTWCPGCGNFAILNAVKQALTNLSLKPNESLIISGIGCGSKLPHYMKVNGFHSIHGRPVAVATGAKLANPDLNVMITAGDGDSYGIGGNHFIHACRRNVNLTHIVENNLIYGLTKGQYSPTSEKGFVTKTTPQGAIEPPVNPIATCLANGATFIARGFSGDVPHLTEVISKAIKHNGYSLVDVFQPCVTFNRVNTYDFYNQRVYKLEEEEGYDPTDKEMAQKKSYQWGEAIPIGIIYTEKRATYEEQVPALKDGPVVKKDLDRKKWEGVDFKALKETFM